MAITLADAKLNTQDDVDVQVIDEFSKSSWLLDNMTFDDVVNPAGGGATLTYGYTRLVTERGASFRQLGTEYGTEQAKRARATVDLTVLGGAFEIDRVLANLGPAATAEVAFQMGQTIKSATAFFSDQVINGTKNTSTATGFEGLSKILAGSSTEFKAPADWSAPADQAAAHNALDSLDEFLGLLDGTPSALLGNKKTIARVRSLARRAGYYSRTENSFGQTVESYNGIPFIDLGAKAGTADPVIGIDSKTGASDLYAVRLGLDAFHGVSAMGGQIVRQWLPDFSTAGAVKRGEVELGPVAVVLKATKSAAVWRGIKVQPAVAG
ncbi:phage capsid protein [Streptosporangium nondiastaticum]|uniref:Phage capsid protein n=1 Tax=Streptosporangium nondiastaticum TaxID=35764 RepID=A0A9X7JTV2_9ACTN|nr:phage capsid protein [Streptosporangium nondiastaticum]PSJ29823.1 phage capsid protein [Streptosporangium nondiastaticum]